MFGPAIVVGDTTDHGGKVVSGCKDYLVDGRQLARVGDKVVCPIHGDTEIVSGNPHFIVDGKPAARPHDKTSCGALLIPVAQSTFFFEKAGSGSSSTSSSSSSVSLLADIGRQSAFDEVFVLRSARTSQPLANRAYRVICADGRVEEGRTDDHGRTHLVVTAISQQIRLELQEEGP